MADAVETVGLSSILNSVTTLFGTVMDMAGTVGTAVVDTPILLVFCLVPVVGLGVGLFKRLININ